MFSIKLLLPHIPTIVTFQQSKTNFKAEARREKSTQYNLFSTIIIKLIIGSVAKNIF